MGRLLVVVLLLWVPAVLASSAWEFGPALDVTDAYGDRVFHHLDSSSRRSIAVSGDHTAVVWEDNRDGTPRCYVAFKPLAGETFLPDNRISGQTEAFSPAIVGIGGNRFAVAWEEGKQVWVRLVRPGHLGTAVAIGDSDSGQPSLAFSSDAGLLLAWSQRENRYTRIRIARLGTRAEHLMLEAEKDYAVDRAPLQGDQFYPSVAVLRDGHVGVAWEDRRYGHTVILYSRSQAPQQFASPVQINESFWGGREQGYGRGTGAMRVALAAYGSEEVVAVWADKRNFLSGYDVYAAFSKNKAREFRANEKVQDAFGNEVAQWHPAVATMQDGLAVVAWDDDRDETSDIWLSISAGEGWSDDIEPAPASGEGFQVKPSLAVDEHDNLHLVWLEKGGPHAPSRLRYAMGKYREDP